MSRLAARVLLLLACAQPGAVAQEVATLLARHRGADTEHAARVRAELAELGADAVPEVLGLLTGARRGPDGFVPNAADRQLLAATLRAWSPRRVVAALTRAAVAPDATLSTQMLAIELLGSVRAEDSLDALREVHAALPPGARRHPRVQAPLADALVEVLTHQDRGFEALDRWLQRSPPTEDLLTTVARALGRVPSTTSVRLLGRLLGRSGALDLVVLEALGTVPLPHAPSGASDAAALLRSHLAVRDPRVRRQTALSLGLRRDREAVEVLVDRLEDPDRRVRRAAHTALVRTAGVALPAETGEWIAWLDREETWRHEALPALALALEGDEPAAATAALRSFALHPVFRRELSELAAGALLHPRARVAVAACATLTKLADEAAYRPLVAALTDGREEVRAAAERALRTLTGLDLAGHAAWSAWLTPGRP